MNQSENLYQKDMQCVLEFLCQRDVDCLDLESVKKWFGGETATAVVVFGNELPQTAEAGCLAFLAGLGERLVFCGGTGHSTELLKKRAGADERYRECAQKTSEAAVFSEIAVKRYGIPEDKILLDETSANCGENAANARMILEGRHILPKKSNGGFDAHSQLRPVSPAVRRAAESAALAGSRMGEGAFSGAGAGRDSASAGR